MINEDCERTIEEASELDQWLLCCILGIIYLIHWPLHFLYDLCPKIKHYEKCWGLSLPSYRRWKVELWFAPPHYKIKPHTHPHEDIKLVFLFGHNVRFHRRRNMDLLGECFFAQIEHIGRSFNIRAGDEHWFDVSSYPLIFLNIEKWQDGYKPTSAAEDLQLT